MNIDLSHDRCLALGPARSAELDGQAPLRLCILMTSFNRKEKTLASLQAIAQSIVPVALQLRAVLVDDGSNDGTAAAVTVQFPWVRVDHGDGNLFWCRGMHQAFDSAMRDDPDFYLWLNDDTMLQPSAIARLLDTAATLRTRNPRPLIVVGSTVDAETGAITYGGERRASALKRSRFLRIVPTDHPQLCDSMNGNIVLVPRDAARIVGNLDPAFEHAMGDTDYALRARKLGVDVWLGAGVFGACCGNPQGGTYMDTDLPLRRRWHLMLNRKGLPWRSWLVLTRRHMGLFWPLYFCWPYLSLLTGKYNRKAAP